MKKTKNIMIMTAVILIFSIMSGCSIYVVNGNPNSSKGFAEYDDTTAEEENKKLEEEQQKNFEIGKSTNNYLDNLQVEGYELTPEFEKQTLEYTLNKEVEQETIQITATANDTKASIEGIGKVALKIGENLCRVDVVAESGTVRTYIIKVTRIGTEKEVSAIVEKTEEQEIEIEGGEISPEENSPEENSEVKKENNRVILVMGAFVLLILGIVFCAIIYKCKFKSKI